MREFSRSARLPGAIALSLLASAATAQPIEYGAPNAALAQPHGTPAVRPTRAHDPSALQQMRADRPIPSARAGARRAAEVSSASPPSTSRLADTVKPRAVPASPTYSAVGHIEEGGVRKAVIASGDRILLKKLGDEVEADFRLVVVDPPALLHLPTGTVVQVPRQTQTKVAPNAGAPSDSDPAVARIPEHMAPIDTTNAEEFEEALARALAAR